MYPKSISNLIEAFKYFAGVGEKTAERMAFQVLAMDDVQTNFLSDSIKLVKSKIKRCKICNNKLVRIKSKKRRYKRRI